MSVADKQSFRDAMACVGAAVNVITTDGLAGRAGFTASAVCSVTDTPPTLLVCLNRSASVWPTFRQHQALCVNTLAAGQESLSTSLAVNADGGAFLPPPTGKLNLTGCPRSGRCAGQLRLSYQPDSQRRHPAFCSVKWPPSSDIQSRGADVVRLRLLHAYASSLLTSNPGYHHGTFRFSSLAVDLPFRRVRRGGPDERLSVGQTMVMGVQHAGRHVWRHRADAHPDGLDPNLAILLSGIGTLLFFR